MLVSGTFRKVVIIASYDLSIICLALRYAEMIDKQRTSTANHLECLPATLQTDAETRLVNRYLAVKSFYCSDAFKVIHAEDIRPAAWCRKTIHQVLLLVGGVFSSIFFGDLA